jgi:hypothetical protein
MQPMSIAALSLAFCAALMGCAPAAGADPAWPSAGSEPASDTIEDLEAQGYNVEINWVGGHSNRPLSECRVPAIHNPNRSGEPPQTFTTVYVDVSCPGDSDDDSGFLFGFGF